MNIIIYEDNKNDIEILKKRITSFFEDYNLIYKIDICPNTQFLIDNIYSYDFLFLDIEINNENGIQIGEIVRKKHKNCHIIITSNYKQYLIDGYKIKADRYLLKPFSQNYFNLQLKNVIQEFYKDTASILDSSISNKRILLKNIIYIEYFEKHSYLKLANHSTLKSSHPLHYWVNKLKPYGFSQCYKSFVANCRHVVNVESDFILLDNDSRIPVSRNYKKEFINNWLESVQDSL